MLVHLALRPADRGARRPFAESGSEPVDVDFELAVVPAGQGVERLESSERGVLALPQILGGERRHSRDQRADRQVVAVTDDPLGAGEEFGDPQRLGPPTRSRTMSGYSLANHSTSSCSTGPMGRASTWNSPSSPRCRLRKPAKPARPLAA